jgi:hypothetical protein
MDLSRILTELRQEKEAIEQAILSIEKLAGAHRRGRPSGTANSEDAPRKRGRPKGSKNRPAPAVTNAAGSGGAAM